MKIFLIDHHGWQLKIETQSCVNAVLIYLKQDIKRVKGRKKTIKVIRLTY